MQMNELLPCPFCGGEAELTTFGFSWEPLAYGVQCIADAERGFDAHGHQIAGFGSAEKAIAAWNSRAKPPCDGGYCPLCGAAERTCKQSRLFNLIKRECDGKRYSWHGDEMPNYCPNCGRKVEA